MYKKILVVVDDRVVTQSAIRQSIEMAHALRADIHFCYVLPSPAVMGFEFLPMAEQANDDLQNEAIVHAKNILDAAVELAEQADILSFGVVASGADGAQCVAEVAKKRHCDLIVVGTEETNAVLRILNGSIVPGLISRATVPVLVCREGSSGGFRRRATVSSRAKQRRLELRDRRRREAND
jgi:nucleotide-binding universal stress UspA family protein